MRLIELFEALPPEKLDPGEERGLDIAPQEWWANKIRAKQQVIQAQTRHLAYLEKELAKAKKTKPKTPANIQVRQNRIDYFTRSIEHTKAVQEKMQKELLDLQAKSQETSDSADSLIKIINYIKKNCRQYLQAVKNSGGRYLWRGLSEPAQAVFVGQSRLDRRPRDSRVDLQIMFDNMLTALGAKALRKNSIFVTSDYDHAESFGDVYIIFPIDGQYNYTYTNQRDITMEVLGDIMEDTRPWQRNIIRVIKSCTEMPAPEKSRWIRVIKELTYEPEELEYEAQRIRPVLKQYGLNITNELDPVIEKASFKRRFQPQTRNLEKALREEVEVYLSGRYIAVNNEVFGAQVRGALKGLVY